MESLSPCEPIAYVEVIYEGDHCLKCFQMAEAAAEATKRFGARARWQKVDIRQRKGAQRYAELSVKNGGVAPIPSLFVNEKLAFETTLPVKALEDYLKEILT